MYSVGGEEERGGGEMYMYIRAGKFVVGTLFLYPWWYQLDQLF